MVAPLAWFMWGALVGVAIAIARLPLDTNLVPVLSGGLFSALILKEALDAEAWVTMGAASSGLVVGGAIDLLITPPCEESGLEIVTRAGVTMVECSRFVETRPLAAGAVAGAVAIVSLLIWNGRSEQTRTA